MKHLFLLLFLAFVSSLQAQTIRGTLIDAEGKPIEYASVRLFRLDSTVATGAYTQMDGSFELVTKEKGNFFIKATYSNHEPVIVNDISLNGGGPVQLGALNMKLDKSLDLEEMKVTGSLDVLKSGIDKKVYSVEQDISVRGGTANDVLGNIPSIEVDQDGNISLRGDGNVTILIDGRPSTLARGDGDNLLDALPANSIERIEVVTNPSAKYDPDGTSGIINIVLKKNRLRGFNGVVSLTGATGPLVDGNVGLSYRGNKVTTYLNYSASYRDGYRNYTSDLWQDIGTDSLNYLDQDRDGGDKRFSNTLVLGADFKLNENNLIAVSVTGSQGNRERTGHLMNVLRDQNDAILRRWDRISRDPRSNLNLDANLNYTRTFKEEKGEWSVNVNQSYGEGNVQGFYHEDYFDEFGNLLALAPLDQRLDNNSKNRITTAQTDMSYIFKKIRARMEAGAKVILRGDEQSTFSETLDTISGAYFEDTVANFDYNYNEGIYSVYGIFGQELGKFKYQVGVRGELAQQTPFLVSTGEKYENQYLNLFPSAHVKYDLSKKTQFSISYSRRINRARSRQLNPFASYANPLSIRRGNPELQPEYIDSYDLGYSYATKKLIVTASVFHRRTRDVINRVKIFLPNNTGIVTYANIDRSESTGGELILTIKPWKWWKNTVSFNGNYIDYTNTDTTVNWNNDGFIWSAKYIANFDFWNKTASAQLNVQYNAPRVTPQGIVQPRAGVDLAVEKRFFDKKLSVGARVTDVFNRRGFLIDLNQEGVRQEAEFKWLTRRYYLTVSYRFGKLDKKLRGPRRTDGGGPD